MPYPWITQADLESRVSAAVVRRLLDDDRDGTADDNAVTRVIADSCAKVAGYVSPVYTRADVDAAVPPEVVRLSLDVAVAYLAQRHPEFVRRDWEPLMKYADAELKAMRAGKTNLGVDGSPEPAVSAGADITVGDPDTFDEDTYEPTFQWGSGDF